MIRTQNLELARQAWILKFGQGAQRERSTGAGEVRLSVPDASPRVQDQQQLPLSIASLDQHAQMLRRAVLMKTHHSKQVPKQGETDIVSAVPGLKELTEKEFAKMMTSMAGLKLKRLIESDNSDAEYIRKNKERATRVRSGP
jgi:hypothetical protein